MSISKRIVTDEGRQPVAVQIDYADWLEIERRLDLEPATAHDASEKQAPLPDDDFGALLEASAGIWPGGDGLAYQRRIREEWARPWDPPAQDEDDAGNA